MKPLNKIIVILVVAIAFIYGLGKICKHGYYLYYKPFYDKLEIVFNNSENYDILLFGNSQVHFGINPKIIDSITHCKSYNIGYAAAGFRTQQLLLENYLQNHSAPKILVWGIRENSFNNYIDISNYHLFYNYIINKSVQKYFSEKSISFFPSNIFSSLQFLFYDDYNRINIISGYLHKSPFTSSNILNFKGFQISTNKSENIHFNPTNEHSIETDSINPNYFLDFSNTLKLCLNKKIKILFVYLPELKNDTSFNKINKISKIHAIIDSICLKNNFQTIDYIHSSEFSDTEFADNIHLNYDGTKHLSIDIAYAIDSLYELQTPPHSQDHTYR